MIAGRYRVGRLIGAGGMGLVFEGQHLTLGTSVAIKLVRPQFASDAHVMQRFVNEARGVASLTSPHVARVFDAGQLDTGEAFLVMEHLVGQDLLAYLRQSGPLNWEEAALYVAQACDGLADAHEHGLIHRDIKPEHLFIVRSDGGEASVKVLDFGIAKHLGRSTADRMTDPGDSIGSPSYMSPEQVQDASNVDARTDIWSLGVVLFEALTTVRPFDGDTISHTQWQILGEAPRSLSELRADLPAELLAIVARCLEKERDRRFGSARQLGEALRALLRQGVPTSGAFAAGLPALVAEDAISKDTLAAAPLPDITPPSERSDQETVASRRLARRQRALRVVVGLFIGVLAVLLLFWAFREKQIVLWPARLNDDTTLIADTDRSWEPAALPLVKLETGAGVPRAVAAVPAPAPETAPEPTGQGADQLQRATSESDSRPPMPRPRTRRSVEQSAPELTPAQVEARYQRWLEQQNLVPVDEVTVDESGTLGVSKPQEE